MVVGHLTRNGFYKQRCKPFIDSDEEVWAIYYKAHPDAKVFPYEFCFGSDVWRDSRFDYTGVKPGVVSGSPRIKWSGNYINKPKGTCFVGDPAWAMGMPFSVHTPRPTCCPEPNNDHEGHASLRVSTSVSASGARGIGGSVVAGAICTATVTGDVSGNISSSSAVLTCSASVVATGKKFIGSASVTASAITSSFYTGKTCVHTGTLLREDTFNRANQSLTTPSDGGSNWTILSGTWTVINNQGRCTTGSSFGVATLESSVADVDVVVQLNAVLTTPATQGSCIAVRASDVNNYIFLYGSTTQASLKKKVAGVVTTLATSSSGFANGDRIRVRCSGNDITVYRKPLRSEEYLFISTVTDSFNNSVTKHGLYNQVDNSDLFDNFSIWDLSSGGFTSMSCSEDNWYGSSLITASTTVTADATVTEPFCFLGCCPVSQTLYLHFTGDVNCTCLDSVVLQIDWTGAVYFGSASACSNTIFAQFQDYLGLGIPYLQLWASGSGTHGEAIDGVVTCDPFVTTFTSFPAIDGGVCAGTCTVVINETP